MHGSLSSRSKEALNALAHIMVEHKGVLMVLRERHGEMAYRRARDKILEAIEECEAAWDAESSH